MSHLVMRGAPSASQLYLDGILDEIIENSGCNLDNRERKDVNFSEILYHRMKQQLDDVLMINGATGEKVTYRQILDQAIPLARALRDQYKEHAHVTFFMNNNQYMAIVYYASFFAGLVPLTLDPQSTLYEIRHFLSLVPPEIIFCDSEQYENVKKALVDCDLKATVVIVDDEHLKSFCTGYKIDLDTFRVLNTSPESLALLVPTSGSSGLPKASLLTQKGVISQLPVLWIHQKQFPRPTNLAMLISKSQWLTHTILMTTCPVFGVPLLMTPKQPTVDHILEIIETFRPSWALLVPPLFAKLLFASGTVEQLDSLEIVLTTGSLLTPNVVSSLKEKLSKTAILSNAFGLTEMHGFITIPNTDTPWYSNGKIVNSLLYKIVPEVDDDKNTGELYLKSSYAQFQGYYKNEEAYRKMFSDDGWYMTGDIVKMTENEEVCYVGRKKFWFKYLNIQITPEELEIVIASVPDVLQSVVVEAEEGPAAAVVLRKNPSATEDTIRKQIHNAVNSTLSDAKRLRGGVHFVPSLPCTHNGKIKRAECKNIINKN